MKINRSQEAMARSRAARRRKRDDGLLLGLHEFANMLVKNGDEVQSINDVLNEHGVEGADFTGFDSRIALIETKEGSTKFEKKAHCIAQVLSHKHDKKRGHTWKTQAWKHSGGKETNGVYYNEPADIFLLPAHRSTITFGKGKNRKRYQVDINLNAGQVKLDPVADNSNSPRAKRSKKAATENPIVPNAIQHAKPTQSKTTPDKNSKQSKRKSKSKRTPQSNSKRTPKSKTPVGSVVKKKRLSSARRRAARNKNEAHANTALDDTPKSKGKKKYVYDYRMRDSYMTITCLTHICNSYV